MKDRYTRVRLDEVGSTNDYAKEKRADGRELIVTAARQTGGRGTKGRSFSSEEGGVYLTWLRFSHGFLAKDAFKIMAGAAVAVCRTLVYYGLRPRIKWPNDIYVGGKKICGILIENALSGKKISSSIVGIGLNVKNVLSDELLKIATTMTLEGVSSSVDEVTERLIEELYSPSTMEEYRSYLGFLGEQITVIIGDERIPATMLSVSDKGKLQVEIDGEPRTFTAAEITVRV